MLASSFHVSWKQNLIVKQRKTNMMVNRFFIKFTMINRVGIPVEKRTQTGILFMCGAQLCISIIRSCPYRTPHETNIK